MLFSLLLMASAEAVVIIGFTCDDSSTITTFGGCLTAEPTLEFEALWQDGRASWHDTVVYDPYSGVLDMPGWTNAAQWESAVGPDGWPTSTTTVEHDAPPGEFFAFEFQVNSGERLYIAGPHTFLVDGTLRPIEDDEALRLKCSANGSPSIVVVPLPAELE